MQKSFFRLGWISEMLHSYWPALDESPVAPMSKSFALASFEKNYLETSQIKCPLDPHKKRGSNFENFVLRSLHIRVTINTIFYHWSWIQYWKEIRLNWIFLNWIISSAPFSPQGTPRIWAGVNKKIISTIFFILWSDMRLLEILVNYIQFWSFQMVSVSKNSW